MKKYLLIISLFIFTNVFSQKKTIVFSTDSAKIFTEHDTINYKTKTNFIFNLGSLTIIPEDYRINLFLVPKSEYDIYNFRCFEDLNVQLKDTTIDNNLGTLYKSIDYNIQIGIFLKSEGVWIVKKDKTKALFYGLRKK